MTSTVDPITHTLKVYREADFVEACQWLHDGAPVDLTGYTLEGSIRRYHTDAAAAAQFAIAVQNAAQGLFELSLTDAETAALAFTVGVYDVRATKAGVTQRLMQGPVKVYPSAT